MKKRITTLLLASAMILSVAGCGQSNTPASNNSSNNDTQAATQAANNDSNDAAPADNSGNDAAPAAEASSGEQGKVLNIYAWNDEFKGFFEKYYAGTKEIHEGQGDYFDKAPGIPDGVTVNWVINPSADGVYQQKLDEALMNQASAAADDKVDFFLAEADYILKYTDSDFTEDISTLGLSQVDTEYQYTVSAASDSNGKIKGVSFQCCPAALIYRRSIAKEVLGTDDPAEVQAQLDSWDKFDAAAAKAKEMGYYMTASFAETYRTFSNNSTTPWVSGGLLTIPDVVNQWIDQAQNYMSNGYTLSAGIWDDEKNAQMFADGKTMTFFGPAWYYNFCMGNAMDPDKGCSGDWAIVEGPQPYFWGGTWLLAATGTDNGDLVADIMRAFTENEDICSALIENEGQFSNNSKVNQKYAEDPNFGNAFLGGQNDTAVYVELAKNIKFENQTIYDQLLNEGIQTYILDYLLGNVDKDTALANFYAYVNEKYPAVQTP